MEMEYIDAHVHIRPAGQLGTFRPELGLHFAPFGRMVFDDGEVYQSMPAYLEDSRFSPEALDALLQADGVSRAVILQSVATEANEVVAAAVRVRPERLRGALVLPFLEEEDLARAEYWRGQGLTVIKFEMSFHLRAYPAFRLDSPVMLRLAVQAAETGMTITVDTGPAGSAGYQVEALRRLKQTAPSLRLVICHLGFPTQDVLADPARRARMEALWSLAELENVWFDLAAMPDFFDEEGYPYPTALAQARRFADRYGCDRLLWGTDIPGTLCRAAYPQMRAMWQRGPFSEAELAAILCGNALRAYFS